MTMLERQQKNCMFSVTLSGHQSRCSCNCDKFWSPPISLARKRMHTLTLLDFS